MVKSGAATSRCTSSSPTSKGKILSRGRSPGTCEQQQPGAAVRIKERRSKRRQKRVAGFSPAVHHDSRVCNRFTNKAATLPPRRPGNCVVRQHWLQTEDRRAASAPSDLRTLSAWWFMSAPQRGHFIFSLMLILAVIGYTGTFSRPYRRVRDVQISSFRNLSMRRTYAGSSNFPLPSNDPC